MLGARLSRNSNRYSVAFRRALTHRGGVRPPRALRLTNISSLRLRTQIPTALSPGLLAERVRRGVDRSALGYGDIRNEPVPMSRDRLDESRIRRIVSELPADLFDALRERAVAHHDIIPNLLEKPILLDEAAMLSHQKHQCIEISGAEVEPFLLEQQLPVGDIESEVAKAVDRGILHDAHEMLRCHSCRSKALAAYYGRVFTAATRETTPTKPRTIFHEMTAMTPRQETDAASEDPADFDISTLVWQQSRVVLLLSAWLFLGTAAEAQQPSLRQADRVRIAEAFRLAGDVGECIWPGWSEIPFAVLLVTPDHEFLVRHPSPSSDFALITEHDSLLQSAVYVRDRQFPPDLLATFPAVGGVSTVVVGQPEMTGKSSTFWTITLLHEHFHQLQNAQPDYYEAVAALDLSGGDETGMWMLNYPFPYDSAAVAKHITAYRDALQRALSGARGPEEDERFREYVEARLRLRAALSEADYRYLSFQLWQEGVARYTEYRVAEVAAAQHEPLSAFRALDDYIPYSEAADSLRRAMVEELTDIDLVSDRRVAFYPLGAAEAFLLDVVHPEWRRRYLDEKFYLERYHEQP